MHGADVKLQDSRGWSALHFLADRGHAQGCSLLFKVNWPRAMFAVCACAHCRHVVVACGAARRRPTLQDQ